MTSLSPLPLPAGIESGYVSNINGLNMHVLQAGERGDPLLLLLHGFPELAYSWRKIMLPLAAKGYFVLAPDQRGYGRTTGQDISYDTDLAPFRLSNLVLDALCLVHAFNYTKARAVIGHDFGSPVAAHCSLIRPDVFPALVLMSAPFGGVADIPMGTAEGPQKPLAKSGFKMPSHFTDLMELKSHQGTLVGRKHYHWYYSQREANDEMMKAPQGLHNFLRAYYYHKSGDCPENASNKPRPLPNWSAETLALLPTYYVMDADKTMPESVTMPTPAEIARETWLADDQLAVYTAEYGRTGFQGGFNWYRIRFTLLNSDLLLFSRRPYAVPFIFVGGDRDWGVWQSPGAVEGMRKLEGFRGMKIVEGAGHWVQQEKAEEVTKIVLKFLDSLDSEGKPRI